MSEWNMNWIALKILASGFVDIIHCQNVTLCICIDITNNYSFSTSFSMLNFSSVFISSSIPYGTISAVIIIFNKVIHPKFSLFFLSRLFRTHVNMFQRAGDKFVRTAICLHVCWYRVFHSLSTILSCLVRHF